MPDTVNNRRDLKLNQLNLDFLDKMTSPSHRPIYTQQQLSTYLSFIKYPLPQPITESFQKEIKSDPLRILKRLQRRQLAVVPFGNVALHYSPHHTVSLDAEALFEKIVVRRLGGYCVENNNFFATVLRSLGYSLYTAGARVSSSLSRPKKRAIEDFGSW